MERIRKLIRFALPGICVGLAFVRHDYEMKAIGANDGRLAGVLTIGEKGSFCGTEHDPVKIAAHERAFSSRKRATSVLESARSEKVAVFFHVITDGSQGVISEAVITEQISILNGAFSTRSIEFSLASVDVSYNKHWFEKCSNSRTEREMKTALRQGTAADLNVYTCGPSKYAAWSTFPWSYSQNPIRDGVVLHYGTLPSGFLGPFNDGEILVHEAGHWMGLYHTFQADNGFDGQCGGNGDYIEDTPDEMTANYDLSCPLGRDTCPQLGLDPVDNYMDYSGDACWTRFTPGQYSRMNELFSIFRAGQ